MSYLTPISSSTPEPMAVARMRRTPGFSRSLTALERATEARLSSAAHDNPFSLPVNGRTIRLPGVTSSGPRPLSPARGINAERREQVLCKELMRERDRRVLMQQSKTPAQIRQWQRALPLTATRSAIQRLGGARSEVKRELHLEQAAAARKRTEDLLDPLLTFHRRTFDSVLDDVVADIDRKVAQSTTPSPANSPPRPRLHNVVKAVVAARALGALSPTDEADVSATSEPVVVPVAMPLDEAATAATLFNRIDELGAGAVHVDDVAQWCKAVFKRPYDVTRAATIRRDESGVVTLVHFARLLYPDVADAAMAAALDTVTAERPSTSLKSRRRARRAPAAEGDVPSEASVHLDTAPSPFITPEPGEVPRVIDRRRWMQKIDRGVVNTLKELYEQHRDSILGVSRARYTKTFARVLPKQVLEEQFDAADIDGDCFLCFAEFSRCVWRGVVPGGAEFPNDDYPRSAGTESSAADARAVSPSATTSPSK